MRYRLRTLVIALALGPPIVAVAWWYGQRIPVWILALALVPDLLVAAFIYSFGALCYLIGRLPGGHGQDSN